MNDEQFIKEFSPKLGARDTFGLMRDTQMEVIIKILISKNLMQEGEFDLLFQTKLEELSNRLRNLPPGVLR